MSLEPQLKLKVFVLTVVAVCGLGMPAWAGPAEDYAEGARHNARGDVVAAMPLFQRAADAGHAGAQAALADLMQKADFSAEALAYYRKSAEQGNIEGQYGLAAMLVMGEGTEQNLPEARKYFTAAAEKGHQPSINELASSYLKGGLGIAESERKGPEALRWIRLSAENGFRPAMEALSKAYRSGDYGLVTDAKAAGAWAEKLAKSSGTQNRRRSGKKEISLEKQ